MATEIRVPTLGESVTEATVGKWFKKAGEAIVADEPLLELETDKVTIEVPAPAAGILSEITANEGETVGLGALLGTIGEGASAKPATKVEAKPEAVAQAAGASGAQTIKEAAERRPRSPAKARSRSATYRRRRPRPSCWQRPISRPIR
jgi:2-oxoglutarate dehydrogenase E2 component (dihydrolipoamide succinyltransferase)